MMCLFYVRAVLSLSFLSFPMLPSACSISWYIFYPVCMWFGICDVLTYIFLRFVSRSPAVTQCIVMLIFHPANSRYVLHVDSGLFVSSIFLPGVVDICIRACDVFLHHCTSSFLLVSNSSLEFAVCATCVFHWVCMMISATIFFSVHLTNKIKYWITGDLLQFVAVVVGLCLGAFMWRQMPWRDEDFTTGSCTLETFCEFIKMMLDILLSIVYMTEAVTLIQGGGTRGDCPHPVKIPGQEMWVCQFASCSCKNHTHKISVNITRVWCSKVAMHKTLVLIIQISWLTAATWTGVESLSIS